MPYTEMDFLNTTPPSSSNKTVLKKLSENPHEIVALLLSCIAIIMNVLTLMSLSQLRKRMTAHYRLIISLALSDILVGASILLFIIHKAANKSYFVGYGPPAERLRSRCFFVVIRALNTTGLNISLLNLVGMGVDHFIAINKPLHYSKILSIFRTNLLLALLWVIAAICGFSDFWTGFTHNPFSYSNNNSNSTTTKNQLNFCELIWHSPYQDEYSILTIAVVSFFIMTVLYINIYLTVSGHTIPGAQLQQGQEAKRNKRALFTTALILGTFLLCWLPMCMFQITLIVKVKTDISSFKESAKIINILYKADKYLYDLLLLNTIFDPIIYTVRMKDIRLGYRRLFRVCLRHVTSEMELRARPSSSRTRSMTGAHHHASCKLRTTDQEDPLRNGILKGRSFDGMSKSKHFNNGL